MARRRRRPRYTNASASDFGVNHDGSGGLSGYAWGQNIGWLNFDTTGDGGSQVTVSPDGAFSGYAWAQNVGWISFSSGYGAQLADTDGDTIPDAFETNTGTFVSAYDTGTLSTDPDTDGDTYTDGEEVDEGTDPTDPLDYPTGPIVVTAPNGGEEWSCGTTVTITWDCNDQGAVGDDVRIGLHKGVDFVDWIIRQTANDGSYSWIVWTDVDPDSDYTIRVQSFTNNAVRDFSDAPFSIIPVGRDRAERWRNVDHGRRVCDPLGFPRYGRRRRRPVSACTTVLTSSSGSIAAPTMTACTSGRSPPI